MDPTVPQANAPWQESHAPRSSHVPWHRLACCAGQTSLMYNHARRFQACALCAGCPVVVICLWSTMAAELDEPYRHGTAGGLGPAARGRLSAGLTRAGIARHVAEALVDGPVAPTGDASPGSWCPESPRRRRPRKCKGCPVVIRQARAGRPQLWCSRVCYQRATRDRAADAARNRQRWANLPPETKERRRAAMAARWAALSPEERAARADRLRGQRRQARVAS